MSTEVVITLNNVVLNYALNINAAILNMLYATKMTSAAPVFAAPPAGQANLRGGLEHQAGGDRLIDLLPYGQGHQQNLHWREAHFQKAAQV